MQFEYVYLKARNLGTASSKNPTNLCSCLASSNSFYDFIFFLDFQFCSVRVSKRMFPGFLIKK